MRSADARSIGRSMHAYIFFCRNRVVCKDTILYLCVLKHVSAAATALLSLFLFFCCSLFISFLLFCCVRSSISYGEWDRIGSPAEIGGSRVGNE